MNKKIIFSAGLIFHSSQYLKFFEKYQMYFVSSSNRAIKLKKKIKFRLVLNFLFFKIITRILKRNYSNWMKEIDLYLYHSFFKIIKLFVKAKIVHGLPQFSEGMFKSFPKAFKILDCPDPPVKIVNKYLNKYGSEFYKFNKSHESKIIEKEEFEINKADLIIVPSTFTYNGFIDYGVDKRKLKVVPIHINEKVVENIDYEKVSNEYVIGFFGGNVIRKGLHLLLEAFEINNLNYKLILKISHNEIKKYDKLLKLIKKNKNITIDTTYYKNISEFYNKIDILVHPAISDGFGMTALEALYNNVPVIVSKNTGVSDYVKNNLNGYIMEAITPKEISDKIKLSLKNLKKLKQYINQNKHDLKKIKSIQENCLDQIYKEI